MSYIRTATASVLRDRLNASEADQETQAYLSQKNSHVDMAWLERYASLDWEVRPSFLAGHTSLARKMAGIFARRQGLSLSEVLAEALIQRRVERWMRQNEEICRELGLWEHRAFPESLTRVGVDGAKSAQRFVDFYLLVKITTQSWQSHLQVNKARVAQIALTPNYNRLPLWVRKGLLNAPASARIGGDRIGNIWRLIPCTKAWKWAPLPKRVAEKVGKCSPKFRMLAAVAWELSEKSDIEGFWNTLDALQYMALPQQIDWIFKSGIEWDRKRWQAFLSESMGLPFGVISLPREIDESVIEVAMERLADRA